MRRFAVATLFGIVLLNFLLGHSSEQIAFQLRNLAESHQTLLTNVPALALAMPFCFYTTAGIAMVAASVGLMKKCGEGCLIYTLVGLLLFDIAALLVLLWGVVALVFHSAIMPPASA
jgi:hypothetical protein